MTTARPRPGLLGVALAVAMVLSGCGGSESDAPDAGSSPAAESPAPAASPTATTEPTASLAVFEEQADWRDAEAEEYEQATDGQGLSSGDLVRTDAAGFAEITYLDGSLTRLDVDTEVEVERLAGTVRAPDVELRMDVGRVWNHLRGDEGTSYVLRTQVANAAVRGTSFLVSCPIATTCTFVVVEGTVEITTPDDQPLATLEAGQGLSVTSEPDGEPDAGPEASEAPEAVAAAAGDPWVKDNAERDGVDLPAATPTTITASGVLAWVPNENGWTPAFRADDGTFYCLRDSDAYALQDALTWVRTSDGQPVVDMPTPPQEQGELVVGTQPVAVSGPVEPTVCGEARLRIDLQELDAT